MRRQLLRDHRRRGFKDRRLAGRLARPASNIKVDFAMTIASSYFTKLSTSCPSAVVPRLGYLEAVGAIGSFGGGGI
jgi:hypothetical protein